MDHVDRPSNPRNRGLSLETGSSRASPHQCWAYLDAVDAIMRSHILQLESLASHGAWIQDTLHEETTQAFQATRAINSSIVNLQTILRGNVALVHEVYKLQSQSASLTMRSHNCCWHSRTLPQDASQVLTPDYLNPSSPESASQNGGSSAAEKDTESSTHVSDEQPEAVFPGPDDCTTPDTLACPTPELLPYHSDVLHLSPGIKLFEPHPSSDPNAPAPSRRVILANLPPSVTAAQVLRDIDARITSIAILHPRLSIGDSTRSFLLEFTTTEAAATFSREADLLYKSTAGRIYRATAWRIPTPSFRRGTHEARMLEWRLWTRTLAVRSLPENGNGIHEFLCRVGAQAVVDARRAGAELVVEFASIREAARVLRLVGDGAFAFADLGVLDIRNVCDEYARGVGAGCARGGVEGPWDRETGDTSRESVTAFCGTPGGGVGDEQVEEREEAVEAVETMVKADEARCSWEEYGRLARQRRDEAKAARLRGAEKPAWWGDIKSAAVPAVVSMYLDTNRITIVDTAA